MTIPSNTIVLDLETALSADDCRHCGKDLAQHYADGACLPWEGERPADDVTQFSAIGWNNKPALGLSIGCYWDYQDSRIHWFDGHTMEATVQQFVERQPLLVSFNGIGFDFVLMRGLLRQRAEGITFEDLVGRENEDAIAQYQASMTMLCDTFKTQCAASYDLLAEIWKADPKGKFVRGVNSLDAIAQANGLGAKLSHGAQAPRHWAAGKYADVLNYCQDDVYKTKALFELIQEKGGLLRGDGQWLALAEVS